MYKIIYPKFKMGDILVIENNIFSACVVTDIDIRGGGFVYTLSIPIARIKMVPHRIDAIFVKSYYEVEIENFIVSECNCNHTMYTKQQFIEEFNHGYIIYGDEPPQQCNDSCSQTVLISRSILELHNNQLKGYDKK